jgi:hypothetical protein
MAKLKSNGETLFEMKAVRFFTDGADGDAMTKEHKITYRAMSSGFILKKTDIRCNYGMGGNDKYYPGTWKRAGKIKADLLNDKPALFNGMQRWADQLTAKGWDAEITQ